VREEDTDVTKYAHVVGEEGTYVDVPRDDDDNHIADAWTYNTGNEGDDNDTSLDNQHNGDGLTRYEEYRGVDINEDGSVSSEERLNPYEKDFFVRGHNLGQEFEPDFAYGEAFEEAEIKVHEIAYSAGERNIDVLVVHLNHTSGGNIYRVGEPFGNGVRNWSFDTLGESGIGTATTYAYGYPCQVYYPAVTHYFYDTPHDDHMTWTAPGMWTGAPNGVLDPVNPERVEDCNDNGEVDEDPGYNEADGNATPPMDNTDEFLDGDHPLPSDGSWDWLAGELSPMDIDNDGLVELPMDNEVPVPAADEADEDQVVRHVATHEMGHAVGINGPYNGHCDDDTCVMYRYANNWKRDGHFCEDCRAMIRIHNN